MNWFIYLPVTWRLSFDRDWVVQIMGIAWIVALLRYFSEVTTLSIPHSNLPVLAFHVLVVGLYLKHRLAIHPSQHILEAIIARVNVIWASILDWLLRSHSGNAWGFAELLVLPNNSHLSRALIIRFFTHHGRVARWRRRTASHEVNVELSMPGCFMRQGQAYLRDVLQLRVNLVPTSQGW